MGRQTNIGVERWRRLTRLRCAGHPLFGFAGKRDLKSYYLRFANLLISKLQTPLSTVGEERVAGVASPGESSTPWSLRHELSGFWSSVKVRHLCFFYIMPLLLIFFSIGCSSPQKPSNSIKINLTTDKHSLQITGLDPLIVQDINRDSSGGNWQSLVPVYKLPADTNMKSYQPVQPGKYLVQDSLVTFTPDTPFIAQKTYFVRYYKFDANSKATDFITGHNKLGSLHYTDLIFKQ
jgi:hypothetical protein